jgi:tellurite resistance protein
LANKVKMLRTLVVMAAADGRIGAREKKLLAHTCELWGLGSETLSEAIGEVESGNRRLSIPKDAEGRAELLDALIAVAAVDGVIEPEERTMLCAVAKKVGTGPEELEVQIQEALGKRESQRRRAAADPSQLRPKRAEPDSEPDSKPAVSPAETEQIRLRTMLRAVAVGALLLIVALPGGFGFASGSKARLAAQRRAEAIEDQADKDLRLIAEKERAELEGIHKQAKAAKWKRQAAESELQPENARARTAQDALAGMQGREAAALKALDRRERERQARFPKGN